MFYVVTAFVYRLPIPVQPMKAVVAVLLTQELAPGTLALSGVMIGAILICLGATGLADRLGRLVPQSVLAGLQLGLGLALAVLALRLIGTAPVLGLVLAAGLGRLMLVPRLPGAVIALVAAIALGGFLGAPSLDLPQGTGGAGWPGLPDAEGLSLAVSHLVLPQLALTVTNALVLTALVAGDYFGPRAAHVTPRRLALTSGLANLALSPFGALPMCHGAGGVAAHHRFGGRSGTVPLLLGLALLVLALLPQGMAFALLAVIPAAGLGALLLVASVEFALSRRLIDCMPSCRPVIAVTAAVTVFAGPMWGLVAGTAAEAMRKAVIRRLGTADVRK